MLIRKQRSMKEKQPGYLDACRGQNPGHAGYPPPTHTHNIPSIFAGGEKKKIFASLRKMSFQHQI